MKFFWKLRRLFRKVLMVEDEFLCDTCKYDYGDACKRPERPNAVDCPDYKRN